MSSWRMSANQLSNALKRDHKMTNVKWLLEKDTFEENLESLKEAINAQGMEYKVIEYIPFEGNKCFDAFCIEDCVVFYGSLNLAKRIKRKTNWVPGAGDINCENHFKCSYYYNKLSEYLLNDKYIMLPFGELNRQKDFLYGLIGNNNNLFIRPNSGYKQFTGTVVPIEKYEHNVEMFGLYDISMEEIVVCAEPKNLKEEWRLVVVDKSVVSGSRYRLGGRINYSVEVPDAVIEYGNSISKVWSPDSAFVLDICRLQNGDLKLVEINTFYSSGLYLCDKQKVVRSVSEMAVRLHEDSQDS